jgi:hypothetical protein
VAVEYFLNITRKGIIIVTLDDGMIYSKESIRENWSKLVIALAIMAGAHEQSKRKAERVGEKWAEKRKVVASKRLTKIGPEWLRPTDDGGWEVIEEKANAVRQIYELHAQGYGKDNIAKMLNKDGIPSLSGKGWYGGTVNRILNSRAAIGEFQAHTGRGKNRVPDGDPVANYFPAIVDEELYQRSQRPKKGPAGKNFTEMTSVFRKLMRCPKCGGTMTLYTTKQHSGKIVRDFACYNHYRSMCDHKGRWRYEKFLDLFIKFVTEIDITKVFDDTGETKNAHNKANMLRIEVDDLEKKIGNVAMSILDDPSPTLNKILRDLERELITKTDELKNAESDLMIKTVPIATVKRNLEESMAKLDEANNRVRFNAALHQIIKKIELYPRGSGINIASARSDEVKLDTTPSFSITFKNGLTRMVRDDGWTMKMDFSKKGA